MKRFFVFIILITSILSYTKAQIFVDNDGNVYDERQQTQTPEKVKKQNTSTAGTKKFNPRNLEFGGSLGLQFGNYTLVSISPQVGYRFSNKLTLGAGLGYTYYSDTRGENDFNQSYASLNLYGNLYPVSFLVLSVKPEISRMWQTEKYRNETFKSEKFVPSVVVGAGLRIQNMLAQIQYDVVQDINSPYGNRLFYTIGYTFGF